MHASGLCCRLAALWLVALLTMPVAQAATAKLAGIAFVDSSVTGQGSRAQLPTRYI